MADNKGNRGKADRARVSGSQASEVYYVARKYGVTADPGAQGDQARRQQPKESLRCTRQNVIAHAFRTRQDRDALAARAWPIAILIVF